MDTSTIDSRRKKPVPLPRSKIPVPQQQQQQQQVVATATATAATAKESLHSRFFGKRSKTDLGGDALQSYKAAKKQGKSPAPKVPTFNRPVPLKRTTEVIEVTSNREKRSLNKVNSKGKPEIKEKPQFSTFKTAASNNNVANNAVAAAQHSESRRKVSLTKMASESDLLSKLREEEQHHQRDDEEEISIRKPKNNNHRKAMILHKSSADNDNKLVIDTSKNFTAEPLTISTLPLSHENGKKSAAAMSEGSSFDCSSSSAEELLMDTTLNSSSMNSMSRTPPSPTLNHLSPLRQHVVPEWDEYEDLLSARKFYYNRVTKEKSWKPPRKPKSAENSVSEANTNTNTTTVNSPISEFDNDVFIDESDEKAPKDDVVDGKEKPKSTTTVAKEDVPDGYEYRTDADSGSSYFVNIFTGVRWFSAIDADGKTYYYEENGNESCWVLPNVSASIQDLDGGGGGGNQAASIAAAEVSQNKRSVKKPLTGSTKRMAEVLKEEEVTTTTTTKTDMLLERKFSPPSHLPVSTPNFQIGSVNIVVVKQGPLHKTKLVENGKRMRKNWCSCHAVLTDTFLLFFKDQKTFASMQQKGGETKPDLCIDLSGARVEWCTGDKSKRNNVFEVSTLFGLTVLVQDDSLQVKVIIIIINLLHRLIRPLWTSHFLGLLSGGILWGINYVYV